MFTVFIYFRTDALVNIILFDIMYMWTSTTTYLSVKLCILHLTYIITYFLFIIYVIYIILISYYVLEINNKPKYIKRLLNLANAKLFSDLNLSLQLVTNAG